MASTVSLVASTMTIVGGVQERCGVVARSMISDLREDTQAPTRSSMGNTVNSYGISNCRRDMVGNVDNEGWLGIGEGWLDNSPSSLGSLKETKKKPRARRKSKGKNRSSCGWWQGGDIDDDETRGDEEESKSATRAKRWSATRTKERRNKRLKDIMSIIIINQHSIYILDLK